MLTQSSSIVTAQGATLVVTSFKAPREDCWNAATPSLFVEYKWIQENSDVPMIQEFGAWIKINANESYVQASAGNISCSSIGDATSYLCTARLSKSASNIGGWFVEVAPRVDGQWDIDQTNYQFSL